MQSYFILRGHKMWADRFIQELNAKYLPFVFKGENKFIELMVRPIQLFEVVYPKECYDVVQTTIFGIDKSAGADAYGDDKMKLGQMAFRQMLGAKPFPDWKTTRQLPLTKNGLSILGIGVREDKTWEYGEGL